MTHFMSDTNCLANISVRIEASKESISADRKMFLAHTVVVCVNELRYTQKHHKLLEFSIFLW